MTLIVQYYGVEDGKQYQAVFKGGGALEAFAAFLRVIGPTNLISMEANR